MGVGQADRVQGGLLTRWPAHRPPPFARGKTAGESHLSGFLESGHTRNCSKAGWKVRGCSALSLWSALDLAPGACRHLRATADGVHGLRSTGASLWHMALSMAAQTADKAALGTSTAFPAPSSRVPFARPRPGARPHPLFPALTQCPAPPPVLGPAPGARPCPGARPRPSVLC